MLPLAPLLAVAGGGTASALDAGSPTSAARAAAALGEQAGAFAVGLRVALLVGTALVAGLALVGLVAPAPAGRPGRGIRVTGWVAAGVVAVAAEVVHLTGDVAVLGTVLQVVAALAAAALIGSRWAALPGAVLLGLLAVQLGSVRTGLPFLLDVAYAVGAAALLGAAATLAAARRGSAATRVRVAPPQGTLEARRSRENAEAPTVRFAAVASGAAVPDEPAGRGGPPLVPVAIVGGLLATAAALAQLLVSGPQTSHDLVGSPYGLASLAAVALPLLAVVGVAVAARHERTFRAGGAIAAAPGAHDSRASRAERTTPALGAPRPGRELARIGAVVGGVGLAAASVLAALPPPGPAPVPGQPLLRTVASGGETLAVLVAPLRPGPNLVHVSGDYTTPAATTPVAHHHGTTPATATVAAGDAPPVPITARDGAGGGWAVVDLPPGKGTLTLAVGTGSATVPVDTGTAPEQAGALVGPDGPECASALLGDLAGQRPGTPAPEVGACPSDALSEADADALRATARGIVDRGVDRIRLVADDSPRSVQAAAVVHEAAPDVSYSDRPDPDSALVVVSGWAPARAALDDASARALETPTHLGGTYLAPWLLTPGVVTATASSVLPLTFDPQETRSRNYAGAVAALFPGEPPATAGYLAWARHEGVPPAPRPTLYGAAPVDVPMTSTGEHHAGTPNPASWFPGGTVVPVSAPLD
ncbi:hypothetical protein [Pseudonocardia oroxyli]|uniref:Uncharacterized protein n=1 Tax=Pseudonocardia oroxyli TaxID=366584 RepID=A0A1G7JLV1_PSEOR|nr:hypothetical protein [Pseudonocardia oroxyli]SDF25917.1 hypothetical protein SAMN05216377_10493 [Pseudonocardia oroxyli]